MTETSLHVESVADLDLVALGGLPAVSDERDRQLALRLVYWREGHRIGYGQGVEAGRAAVLAEQTEARQVDALAVHHVIHDGAGRLVPPHAELEARRWGSGDRTHFGNPRPGDFEGRGRVA